MPYLFFGVLLALALGNSYSEITGWIMLWAALPQVAYWLIAVPMVRRHLAKMMPQHWRFAYFRPMGAPVSTPIRTWFTVRFLRFMLLLGFVILLVGRCRSGKTYLINRTLASTDPIIDGRWDGASRGPRPFDSNQVPPTAAVFAIDEAQGFEQESMVAGLKELANRSFILCAQSRDLVNDLAQKALGPAARHRMMLIELGAA